MSDNNKEQIDPCKTLSTSFDESDLRQRSTISHGSSLSDDNIMPQEEFEKFIMEDDFPNDPLANDSENLPDEQNASKTQTILDEEIFSPKTRDRIAKECIKQGDDIVDKDPKKALLYYEKALVLQPNRKKLRKLIEKTKSKAGTKTDPTQILRIQNELLRESVKLHKKHIETIKNEELDLANAEYREHLQRVNELLDSLKQKDEQLNKLEKDLRESEERYKSQLIKFDEQQKVQIQQIKDFSIVIQKQNNYLEQQKKDYEKKIEDLKREHETEIQKYKHEIEQLIEKKNSSDNELQSQLAMLEGRYLSLQRESAEQLEEYQKSIEKLTNELNEAQLARESQSNNLEKVRELSDKILEMQKVHEQKIKQCETQHQQELNELKTEISKKDDKISSLEELLSESSKAISLLKADNDNLRQQIEQSTTSHQNELEKLISERDQYFKQVCKQKELISQAESSSLEYQNTITELKNNISKLELQNNKLQAAEKELNQKLIEVQESLRETINKLATTEGKLQGEQQKYRQACQQIAEKDKYIEALESENAEHVETLKNMDSELENIKNKLRGPFVGKTSFTQTSPRLSSLQHNVQSLEDEKKKLLNEMDIINHDLQKVEDKVSTLTREKQEMKDKIEQLTTENNNLHNTLVQLELLLTEKEALHKRDQAELATKSKKIVEIENKLAEMEDMLTKSEKRLIEIKQQMTRNKKSEELTKEVNKLTEYNKQLLSKLQNLENEKTLNEKRYTEEIKTLMNEKTSLETRLKELQIRENHLDDKNEIEALKNYVNSVCDEIKNLKQNNLDFFTEQEKLIQQQLKVSKGLERKDDVPSKTQLENISAKEEISHLKTDQLIQHMKHLQVSINELMKKNGNLTTVNEILETKLREAESNVKQLETENSLLHERISELTSNRHLSTTNQNLPEEMKKIVYERDSVSDQLLI